MTETDAATTEEKIKEAARRVFTKKGFAATRTRDIAEEAGFNLALLNYYFRSKEKLFQIIMLENLHLFIDSIRGIVNDETTTLVEKITLLAHRYIDMLIAHPGLPLFILSEVNANPEGMLQQLPVGNLLRDSVMGKQWREQVAKLEGSIHPLHIFMNMMSLILFPFVASPIIKSKMSYDDEEFRRLMEERKQLIPYWVSQMLTSEKKYKNREP
ncbi:MAG: TetR/AcrR family transcriptional regulator [Chitinophagia bacterium]|nr:TetR/AcrR family transcriptional regulator [Chitinophagia bacterium]